MSICLPSWSSVGIGTTSPAATLDVRGRALFQNPVNGTDAYRFNDAAGIPLMRTLMFTIAWAAQLCILFSILGWM